MRLLCILLLIASPLVHLSAQSIDYTVPKDYKDSITKEDYKSILDQTVAMMKTHMKVKSVKAGAIAITGGEVDNEFYIEVLLSKCIAEKDKSKWQGIIKGHFEDMFSEYDIVKSVDTKNYESVKNYVSIRVYPADFVKGLGLENVIAKVDIPGTYTVLVIDLPGAFNPVTKENLTAWGKSEKEVFDVVQAEIDKAQVAKEKQDMMADGAKIFVYNITDDDYAASYAIDLQHNAPELMGEYGVVVCIPNRSVVSLCKISSDRPKDYIKFIKATKADAERLYSEHPQPVSLDYFWYYNGVYIKIDVAAGTDNTLTVTPPSGLAAMLSK